MMAGWLDNMYNQSFAGSYANARRMRNDLLLQQAANDNDSGLDMQNQIDALRAQQGQAVAGGIISGLTGATTLLSNAFKDAQIQDTSMIEGQIDDLRNAGNYNYNNYDQLANDYAQTNFGGPSFSYQDIRGMSTGDKIGSVGTSTLSGAATGLQIGGGWGALIGGGIGLLSGLGGVFAGDAAARIKQESLNLQASLAADAARQNFEAAHERIGDNIHRQNAVNAVKYGGKIQTIKEYANKVLSPGARQREYRPGGCIKRIHGEGGLTIRIQK